MPPAAGRQALARSWPATAGDAIPVGYHLRLRLTDRQPIIVVNRLCATLADVQKPADDPILKRFRATLDELYGQRLERVVLYGSRARGDAREDSDYDVAVFLRDMPDRIAELYRLADLSTAILADGGGFIHAMAYPSGSYNDPRMPLMYAIRAEGIDL
jgi:predicted nucleotidyltransferase